MENWKTVTNEYIDQLMTQTLSEEDRVKLREVMHIYFSRIVSNGTAVLKKQDAECDQEIIDKLKKGILKDLKAAQTLEKHAQAAVLLFNRTRL